MSYWIFRKSAERIAFVAKLLFMFGFVEKKQMTINQIIMLDKSHMFFAGESA